MTDFLDLKNKIKKNDAFCFYPFLEISTRPNGVVFPCCYWNDLEHLSKIEKISDDNSILDLWNSERIVNIRRAMIAGQKLSGCDTCYRDGAASMQARSIKESINNELHLKLVENTIAANGIAEHLPVRLELKPNNLCNLKCISCNAYDSSQIEEELKQLDEKYGGIKTIAGRYNYKVTDVWKKASPGVWEGKVGEYVLPNQRTLNWAELDRFWEDMQVVLPKIEVLSFAGGEPTLNPIVFKILTYCVEKGYDKNIIVYLSSNFTNLKDDFFKLMKGFKRFELIASVDGIGKVQEYLRFPSKWSSIKRNFELAKTYMTSNNNKLVTNITVSILNIFYLRQLLDFIDSTDNVSPSYHQWPYNINLLNWPMELQISWIPSEFRKKIIFDLEDYKKTSLVLKRFPGLSIKIDLLLNELSKTFDSALADKQLKILYEIVTTLDENRRISYKDCIPFLEEIFEIRGIK